MARYRQYSGSALLESAPGEMEFDYGSSAAGDSSSGGVDEFDPMMGRLEVIEPGIAMFHGFANVAFAYGGGEMLAIDTSSARMGALAVKAIREVTVEPFAFLIYTHGHGDHAFGTEAFINDNLSRGYPRPKIWAHEDVDGAIRALPANARMANAHQPHSVRRAHPSIATFADSAFTLPDLTYRDMQMLELEREPVELRHAMGETDDATWVWMPRRRLAMVGDLIVSSLPNTGNPNKVQRYTLEWAEALEQIAARKPRIVLPGHGPAYQGEDVCHELLTETARALRFIHDEVVARLNRGEWPVDLIEAEIKLPDHLASKPFLRPVYGCVPFVVRDVIRRYAGWWSGQPSQMFPAKRSEVAAEILGLCGRDQILARARTLKDSGELKQALALAEMALDANASDAARSR